MGSSIHSVTWPLLAVLTVSASRPAHGAPDVVTPVASSSTSPAPQPVEMRDVVWGSRYGELRHKPVPFQGNLMLDDPGLFRLVGRGDLLRAYEERVGAREAITLGGLLTLVGSAFAFAAARPRLDCSGTGDCQTERSDGALAAGLVLLVISASLIVADATMTASPISDDERVGLIDKYNRSIKQPNSPRQ